VYVTLTKDEIKDSPEWDDERKADESYRSEVGTYYSTRD
jgi:stress response protein YsnF